ncbi:uncharacterized protein LOC125314621 [Rhodamnia argentea]|uniref:Uncharacterized protein LOC125314621 n=1 Tax=Rhodamnia argentea TaxID=178133 RepID=A0ABM3H9U5_9MYRT|nr:uncharacterized protein LOC125314621 [Rhodamnia argentea]
MSGWCVAFNFASLNIPWRIFLGDTSSKSESDGGLPKSKSFNNLLEVNLTEVVSSARDLEKLEHPFNKKRRILRWSKNFSLLSAKSMPLFPLSEEDDDAPDHCEGDDGGSDGDGEKGKAIAGRHGRKRSLFKSSNCFALSDLQEEDEEDDKEKEEDGGNQALVLGFSDPKVRFLDFFFVRRFLDFVLLIMVGGAILCRLIA